MPHITHVNNILFSFFSNAELYITNQQIYNFNGLYSHKSHISNNCNITLTDYKGCCIVGAVTLKKFQKISSKVHFSQEE